MPSKAPLAQPTFNSSAWDVPLNSNFGIVTDALGTVTSVSVTTTNVTLTATQAQRFAIAVSGSLTGARNLLLPQNCIGSWVLVNTTGGGFNLSIFNDNGSGSPAGSGITPPTGYSYVIYSDGTNVSYATSNTVQKSGDTMVGSLALPSNGLNVGSGQLQVSGGNVLSTGSFQANVNVTALSDERVKENIETIENALDLVKEMRGVRYKRKDTGDIHVGVISQEIREVAPEVVSEGKDGLLHVAYGNLIGVLINAMKELEQRVSKIEG